MYPSSSYINIADLYLLGIILGLLIGVLAYGLRQLRLSARELTGERQRWRDRSERAESELRRLRTSRQQAIAAAIAAERERVQMAHNRIGELSGLLATYGSTNQQQAVRITEQVGVIQQLQEELWRARHARGEDVRRLLRPPAESDPVPRLEVRYAAV